MIWSWQDIQFREPWFLLFALLAVPIFWLAMRTGGRVVFSSFRLLPARTSSWRTSLAWLPDAALALSAVAMALALAGPRVQERETRIKREGISIMMVMDTSSSMRALDLSEGDDERTRLEAVKEVFIQFVEGSADSDLPGRPDDSIGIVSFAGFADTRCPLTLNHGSLIEIARDLEIVSDRSEDGTAIGDGLALALERLREAKTKSKVAILLTDGVNTAGIESPLTAADLAKTLGIKVYTIGAGTTGIAHARVEDFFGRSVLRPVRAEIDEKTLEAIAERTGGQYFRATDAESLRRVYGEIDKLERSEISEQRLAEYDEYYVHVLALALLLACLGWLLRFTIFRRLPC